MTKYGVFLILLVLVSLSALVSASVNLTVLEWKKPRHLGDQNITAWEEAWRPEGLTLQERFYLEAVPVSLRADMMTFGYSYDPPPVAINNLTTSEICMIRKREWTPCNATIKTLGLVDGTNTFNLSSVYWWVLRDWGDFMVKDFKLIAEYPEYEPHVMATKTQSAYESRLGEPVNVTVSLTNVGVRPAFNVSAMDMKPQETYLLSGDLAGNFSRLRGSDIYVFHYVLIPTQTGQYESEPGEFEYYTFEGVRLNGTIEPLKLTVKPQIPAVYLYKTLNPTQVETGADQTISLVIVNNGSSPAYGVEAYDHLPGGFSLRYGTPNMTFPSVDAGQNVTYNYTVSSSSVGTYLSSAEYRYLDSDGYQYNRTSDYANLTVTPAASPVGSSDSIIKLAAVAAVIAVLLVIYVKVSS